MSRPSVSGQRRLSQIAVSGGRTGGAADGLNGWGTYSAAAAAGSVAELDQLVLDLKEVGAGNVPSAAGNDPEQWLRSLANKLARALVDEEVAQRFNEKQGLIPLVQVLSRDQLLKSAGLSYVLQALKGFATHPFGSELLAQSSPLQLQVFRILHVQQQNADQVASSERSGVVKAVLGLLLELTQRASGGFSFVLGIQQQHQGTFFPMLFALAFGSRNLGPDVQLLGARLFTSLLRAAKDARQFTLVTDEITKADSTLTPEGKKPLALRTSLDQLLSNGPSDPLKSELDLLLSLLKGGYQGSDMSAAGRKEIAQLRSQLSDVSQLATEYRATVNRLESELKNFKRREPLVQLLWAEIAQLRGALAVAISGGFSYDLSDPASRYVQQGHFAYIDRLDVTAWAPRNPAGQDARGGGGTTKAGAARRGSVRRRSLGDSSDEDGGGDVLLPHFIDENGEEAAPPPPPTWNAEDEEAERLRNKRPAGMYSGDEAEHLQSAAEKIAGGAFGAPPPQAAQPAGATAAPESSSSSAAAASASSASTVTNPDAPAPPMAPSIGVPSAPGAPNAPTPPGAPGAPSAPGAPLMRTGAQPTKPAIKPLRKMRPLHWNRLILPVGNTDSIWTTVEGQLTTMAKKVPIQEIDALFADPIKGAGADAFAAGAAAAAAGLGRAGGPGGAGAGGASSPTKNGAAGGANGGGASSGGVRENVRVLSDKRFNAVAIMLSFLPPVDKVIAAVQRLDSTTLSKDQVAALHKQMPTEEELKALAATECRLEELAKPEAFLATLSSAIPAVGSRIDCWSFKLSFHEVVSDLRTPFAFIERAIVGVRTSQTLPQLCALVLHTGNYINGSTNRGQADGFDLAVLGRLNMVKDSTGSGGNLLAFIVHKLLDVEGSDFATRLMADLGPCKAAAEFPLRPALAASTRFQGVIKLQKNLAALVMSKCADTSDPFLGIMSQFGKESEQISHELKTQGQSLNESFGQMLHYLNPCMDAATAAKTQSEELFATLAALAEQVQAVAEQRKQAAETKAAEQKQMEIRERQKAIRAKLAAEKAAAQ